MPGRAAREDDDALDLAQHLIGNFDLVKEDFATLCDARPRTVSFTAHGCSKISFSMKCLYPAFSAMTGSHDTFVLFFDTARPE
jgi:hypothetical protein